MKKILFLAANPQGTSQLQLDQEISRIDESLRRSKLKDQFQLVSKWAVDSIALRRALLDEEPDIVHFSGHGTGAEGLVLVGQDGRPQPAPGDALADLFSIVNSDNRIRCVLLNACYAEEQAKAIYQYIDNVIGMRREVKDDAAIAFAAGFYDGLGYGKSIAVAFKLGCVAIRFELASFSQTNRQLESDRKLIPVLEQVAQEAIPEYLVPVLLSRESEQLTSPNSPISAVSTASIAEELRIPEASNQTENIQRYRERITEFLEDGELTPIEKVQLAALANVLGIPEAKANELLEIALASRLSDLYEKARQYYQSQKWQRVIDTFKKIDAFNTNYPDHDRLRESARQRLRDQERQQRERKLADLYQQASHYMDRGEWQDCLKTLERIQQIQPGYRDIAALIEKAQRAIAGEQNIGVALGLVTVGWLLSWFMGSQPGNNLDSFSVAQLAGWVGGFISGAAIPLMSWHDETASAEQMLGLLGWSVAGAFTGGLLWWMIDLATPDSAGNLVLMLQLLFSVALSAGTILVWRSWDHSR